MSDPVGPGYPMPRVQFRERQRLFAADLLAEQEYLGGLAGRHLIGHHDWGVVRGLELLKKDGIWQVLPGLAVDGYAREVVVPNPVTLAIDAVGTFRVALYYCEDPWPPETPGCVPRPAPMIRQTGRIVTMPADDEAWSDPRDWPSTPIASARAAGGVGDLDPWPILLGVFDDAELALDRDEQVKYAGARAAGVRAPSRRAELRVGRRALADRYQFAVATADGTGTPQDRFTIDRDGILRFVRTLELVGPRALAVVQLSQKAFLRIEAADLGLQGARHIRIAGRIAMEGNRQVLEVTAIRREPSRVASEVRRLDVTAMLQLGVLEAPAELAKKRGARAVAQVAEPKRDVRPLMALSLVDAAGAIYRPPMVTTYASVLAPGAGSVTTPGVAPLGTTAAATAAPVEPDRPKDFVAALRPSGGTLSMRPITAPDVVEEEDSLCADPRRDETPDEKTPGGAVRFRPGAGKPNDPLARYFRTRRDTSTATITDTLELGLGPFQEADFAPRLAVGSREKGAAFKPWFSVAGNKRVKIPLVTDPIPAASNVPTLLSVTGRLTLPPVKALPTDPLFNALLILGYIGGLQSLTGVSRFAAITFTGLADVPAPPPPRMLTFSIQVTRQGNEPVIIKSGIIALILPGGTRLIPVEPLLPAPLSPLPVTLNVQNEPVGAAPGPFQVAVSLRLGVGAGGNIEAGASATSDVKSVL